MTERITWTNEKRKLRDLKPWARNPRVIKTKQAERLVESVNDFGQVETLAIGPDGELYNGHQRLSVLAGAYGLDYEVDVRVASRPLSEKERERLTVYLHRGTTGEWDFDLLANEFEIDDLLSWGFDAFELGIEEPEADAGSDTEPQIDKAEELRVKWDVSLGQLWQLGDHRLICGDCTDKATVARLMGGDKAEACITDPPYGTASESKVQKRGDKIKTFDIEWDKDAPIDWIPVAFDCLDDGSAIISFWDKNNITRLWDSLKNGGFNPLQTVYWKKTTVPQPRPNFCSSIESSVFARKPGKVLCWNGGGATPNVFEANRAAGGERVAHETQKPLSLFSWLVELVTDIGHTIYDPFSGSGTTLIACENLGRKCRAVELSPAYVAVALQRFADHTGIEPVLVK